jgi:AbrB family looped-hinge helix DNA binding protein
MHARGGKIVLLMETRLSTKGQVVLPNQIRRKLGLRSGDPLDAKVQNGSVVLTPRRSRNRKPKIVVDKLTGLPVLSLGGEPPLLTSKDVAEILANFP